jgi:hypothetical protein
MVYYEYEAAVGYERSYTMEAIVIGLLVVLVGALLFPKQQPATPPLVIYIEGQPDPVKNNLGCLPALVLLSLLAIILLGIGVS